MSIFRFRIMVLLVGIIALFGSSVGVVAAEPPPEPSATPSIPAGHYTLDKAHSTITFKLSHLGFSFYTGSFSQFYATLDFDQAHLESSKLEAKIEVASLNIPAPPSGFLATLTGPDWLNAVAFPTMTFHSKQVIASGDNAAQVLGELTLNGKTAPVTLEVTFNGGYAGVAGFDPNARIGFSAHGSLERSDFGIASGIPPAGSTIGVGDTVSFMLETEFSGPPLQGQ